MKALEGVDSILLVVGDDADGVAWPQASCHSQHLFAEGRALECPFEQIETHCLAKISADVSPDGRVCGSSKSQVVVEPAEGGLNLRQFDARALAQVTRRGQRARLVVRQNT